MRLCEDLQEEIIEQYKILESKYKEFKDACASLEAKSDSLKDINFEADYVLDFVREEVWDKIKVVRDAILDEFYPIDYADDEEDPIKAGERYRNSKDAREEAFN